MSDKQTTANRANAQKSTGPRTPEGKAAVHYNALRHGLYASAAVLTGESQEKFDALCDRLQDEWHPQSASQLFLVECLVAAEWGAYRVNTARQKLLYGNPMELLPLEERLDQHEIRLRNAYQRALNHLRSLLKDRPPVADPAPDSADREVKWPTE